jgi:hypothetical protein
MTITAVGRYFQIFKFKILKFSRRVNVLREKWTPVYAVERIDVCNGGVHEVPTIIPEIERWLMGLIENI